MQRKEGQYDLPFNLYENINNCLVNEMIDHYNYKYDEKRCPYYSLL